MPAHENHTTDIPFVSAPVEVDVLVKQVYESSDSATKNRMLNLLFAKAYDTAPAQVKTSLLEQLMRSVGILGLVTVAGGVFAKIRLRGGWPDITVLPDDLKEIQTSDVMALAALCSMWHIRWPTIQPWPALARSVC